MTETWPGNWPDTQNSLNFSCPAMGDPRSGMTPKWGFGVAMLLVGALLCFSQAHFGHTMLPKWPLWAHLFYSVFYSASELRRACFRQARVAQRRASARRIVSCRGLCASSPCRLPFLGHFWFWALSQSVAGQPSRNPKDHSSQKHCTHENERTLC